MPAELRAANCLATFNLPSSTTTRRLHSLDDQVLATLLAWTESLSDYGDAAGSISSGSR